MSEEELLREIADLLSKRESRTEMVGEFLREIALLLVVFVPLDGLFASQVLSLSTIAAIIGFALAVGYAGKRVEESRR